MLKLLFTIIIFFAIYYLLKNNGYITVDRNFDLEEFLKTTIKQKDKIVEKVSEKYLQENNSQKSDNSKKLDNSQKLDNLDKKSNEIKKNDIQSKNSNIYLDLQINDSKIDRIEIELYDNIVPKTANNFRSLCKQKMYAGCQFHRIVKNFMIQGGDFTKNNGKGGRSIYGETFEDENFKVKHDKPGIISMANKGPNTNNSQFFMLFKPATHLDNKHVAFGIITKGLDILNKYQLIPTDYNNKPASKCIIKDCGILENENQEIESNI